MYLWVLDRSSSNQEWNFEGRISSSSDVPGSGEGSRAEYEVMEIEGLGSAARKVLVGQLTLLSERIRFGRQGGILGNMI